MQEAPQVDKVVCNVSRLVPVPMSKMSGVLVNLSQIVPTLEVPCSVRKRKLSCEIAQLF